MSIVETRPVEMAAVAHPFRVWMRPMGFSWRIAVEAGHEAKWLIDRLAEHGFDSTDFVQDSNDLHCTFRCLTSDQTGKEAVEKLLNQWPEVKVQFNPEYSSGKANVDLSPHLLRAPLGQAAHAHGSDDDVEPFRVWIRPLSNAWKVRTEGADSSRWLRNELQHRGLTCSSPSNTDGTCMQTFQCMSQTPHEATYVWNLLKSLPQVLLQNEPA